MVFQKAHVGLLPPASISSTGDHNKYALSFQPNIRLQAMPAQKDRKYIK